MSNIKLTKNQITIIIILCAGLLIGVARAIYYNSFANAKSTVTAKVKGDPKAPVKVTEFIDLQCPACAQGSKKLKEIMTKTPGLIYLELKYFPLRMHKHALMSSRYAECALQQNKFWSYVDILIDQQDRWSTLIDAKPAFEVIAKDVGLDMGKLTNCLNDEKIDEIIQKDKEEGDQRGVQSTPTYFVNEKMVVGIKLLEEELNKYIPKDEN